MNTIPAPGSHGYTAREVLVLARVHKVPGQLISRSRNGRYETRAYPSDQPDNPHVIIATPEQHYTGDI